MKLPAFQFYPGDWRKDTGVQSLDYESRGIWFEILCLMHESERRGILELNMRAMPDDALARLLGIPEILLKQILTKIEAHGVASREPGTGALMCRRMVRDENLRKIRQEAGKQGGNPVLLKQNQTTRLKQKSTPSSSSSSSSSDDTQPSPADAVVAAWNAASPPLPKCLSLSSKRKASVAVRLKDPFFAENYPAAILRAAASDFCLGKTERGWRMDFEFFIKPDSVAKIMEGKYDNRTSSHSERNGRSFESRNDYSKLG